MIWHLLIRGDDLCAKCRNCEYLKHPRAYDSSIAASSCSHNFPYEPSDSSITSCNEFEQMENYESRILEDSF